MDIRQIKLSRMATFCYLVGDPASHFCALIDPAFDTDRLLNIAAEAGYTITDVINTHRHPDHCAGNAAIMAATGARLLIHHLEAKALGGFINRSFCRALGGKPSPPADILLRHDQVVTIGDLNLTVLHTPGHTPGGICLHGHGQLFTGDTLFVGSVGRTDLPGGSSATLLASIQKEIYALPDETVIWPGHDYGPATVSTVGREKQTNPFTG
ncbi:MAG: MBL fold metallo-hydrolase [Desulfosudaceae bacterium]